VNSILCLYNKKSGLPKKIGLYTSPHLVAVRERIRINSEPISEELFTRYFFEIWHRLEDSARKHGDDPDVKPVYFRYLTLMSFHVFMSEGVDAAIYEVGVGGELDSTNVLERPAATGITTLGIDHVQSLGDTIDKIAWHKAGIFKRGIPAFTVDQVPEAMEVLQIRAIEKSVELKHVPIDPLLHQVVLKPDENFQRGNAMLAMVLADTLLQKFGTETNMKGGTLPDNFVRGLETVVWRGRCEEVIIRNIHWYLDGAHTNDSLSVATSWFARSVQSRALNKSERPPRILIFNQQSQRNAVELLEAVYTTMYNSQHSNFQHAIFCTNVTYTEKAYKTGTSNLVFQNCDEIAYLSSWVDFVNRNVNPVAIKELTLQKALAAAWLTMDPNTKVAAVPSIEEAVEHVRRIEAHARPLDVLVTGSFHLVGGMLSILEGEQYGVASITAQ
jgi:folylpolyglutamate synthase